MNSPNISEPERIEPRTTTVPAQCVKHGAYQAKQIHAGFGTPPLTLGCPECQQEERAAAHARNAAEDQRRERDRIAALFRRSCIPERYVEATLDSYRCDNIGQKRAHALAKRYIEAFEAAHGASLVFCGKPGTGKTHLACGIGRALVEQGRTALFVTVLAAIRHIKDTYRKDSERSETDAIADFLAPELLILDEVGAQIGSEHEKLLLFEIINERYQRMRATILISNLTADELSAYMGDRVLDRFREAGAIVAFDWASYRGKRAS